jgi:hypothetical protein
MPSGLGIEWIVKAKFEIFLRQGKIYRIPQIFFFQIYLKRVQKALRPPSFCGGIFVSCVTPLCKSESLAL